MLFDLSLLHKRVLKAAAGTFLIVNGIITFLLRKSFDDQFDQSPDDSDDTAEDQKSQLIALGVFTLLILVLYITRGFTMEGLCQCSSFVAGIYTICCGFLVSSISFFVMASSRCDKDCAEDLNKEAVDKYPFQPLKQFQYILDDLADKENELRWSSTVVGLGLVVALVGYALLHHTAWKRTSWLHGIAMIPVYLGLALAAIGYLGAFHQYADVLKDRADGKVVTEDDADNAKDAVLGFLCGAGVGFLLAGIGEGISLFFLADDEESKPESDGADSNNTSAV